MAAPSKPEKPTPSTRKPRTGITLKLTDSQVAEVKALAAQLGDPEWGTTVSPKAVASRALMIGLAQLRTSEQ